MIDWIALITGIGAVYVMKRRDNHRDAAVWTTQASAATTFIQQIAPFLKVKAEIAALFTETLGVRLTNPKLYADREWQDDVLRKCRILNSRGVNGVILQGRKRFQLNNS